MMSGEKAENNEAGGIVRIRLVNGNVFEYSFDICKVVHLAGGFTRIERAKDGLKNVLSPEGKWLSDEWFAEIYFNGSFFRAQDHFSKQYLLLDLNGNLVLPGRYYWVDYPSSCPGTKTVYVARGRQTKESSSFEELPEQYWVPYP